MLAQNGKELRQRLPEGGVQPVEHCPQVASARRHLREQQAGDKRAAGQGSLRLQEVGRAGADEQRPGQVLRHRLRPGRVSASGPAGISTNAASRSSISLCRIASSRYPSVVAFEAGDVRQARSRSIWTIGGNTTDESFPATWSQQSSIVFQFSRSR